LRNFGKLSVPLPFIPSHQGKGKLLFTNPSSFEEKKDILWLLLNPILPLSLRERVGVRGGKIESLDIPRSGQPRPNPPVGGEGKEGVSGWKLIQTHFIFWHLVGPDRGTHPTFSVDLFFALGLVYFPGEMLEARMREENSLGFEIPSGACDFHVHVFEPGRLPTPTSLPLPAAEIPWRGPPALPARAWKRKFEKDGRGRIQGHPGPFPAPPQAGGERQNPGGQETLKISPPSSLCGNGVGGGGGKFAANF
jgi:hypothetical protein